MDLGLFIQGIIIGLTLAVPVGPISLVCIHRTVAAGRLHGIVSGLGVATADTLYAAVAFLGLTAVSGLIIDHQTLFRLLTGIALVLVGIQVFRSVPAAVSAGDGQAPYLEDYLSLFAIAAANPLTIIFFITILPGFGVVAQGTTLIAAVPFVAGIFLGSAAWWIVLCGSLGSVRSRLGTANLRRINRISGILITLFGAAMLILLFTAAGLFG
ncbi:MAG: LysE family translocator [Methanoregula sp.]|jgi:threonine/homoserine/homoserine lactone efflux protein|nr:LysE family translocator [Methanoregula sp.]